MRIATTGMFQAHQYRLIDFGEGRRLERFGMLVLDRPCPAAERVEKADPAAWGEADARFERGEGQEGSWQCRAELPERWTIAHGRLVLELKRTEFGHLGLFAEQAANWDWIAGQVAAAGGTVRVLNLFAYTGASTLAAAAAGAEVVHVDAARNIVAWARRNAELSGLTRAPVRWITEDAMKFVKRERKRGTEYYAVVLDPPSYGHGRRGEVWRLSRDLPRLLSMCAELTAGRRRFVLLSAHTPKFGPTRLRDVMLQSMGGTDPGRAAAAELTLCDAAGRTLPSGAVVRWARSGDG
jgi:23S rRNA (cytosine1962-C5)-methyltransferase